MKTKLFLFAGLLTATFFLITSFSPQEKEKKWEPIFMTRADLEQSVKYIHESRPLKNPGKIYTKGNYIYVNELFKGVHVINNSNPANPVNEGFILVPGCVDMAVKEHILYVDNAVDLVAFDLESKQVTQRLKEVLPETPSPAGNYFYKNDERPQGLILVSWNEITR
jgi:hypothetical protein